MQQQSDGDDGLSAALEIFSLKSQTVCLCVCVWPIKHQDAYFPPCSTGQTVYFLLTGAQIHLAVRGASTSNPFKKIHNINVTNFSYCDTKESVVDMLCTNENS